jgi:hypothetical protein
MGHVQTNSQFVLERPTQTPCGQLLLSYPIHSRYHSQFYSYTPVLSGISLSFHEHDESCLKQEVSRYQVL